MGLTGRIGIVFSNSLIIIPVFILLLVTAIMTSIGAAKLDDLTGTSTAHQWVSWSTVALWILFVGGLGFMFTIGLFIIPWVVTIPYLFGGALSIFGVVNLAIAGILFYGANAARTSPEYKDTSDSNHDNAKTAFNTLLISGLMMTIASLLMFGYSAFTIYKYHKEGGLTGDVALVGKYGGDIATLTGQPELAIPLQTAGGMAKRSLHRSQQAELEKRGAKVGQLKGLAGQISKATKQGGIKSLISNPEFVEGSLGALI